MKKNIFCFIFIFISSSCTFLNALPNEARGERYADYLKNYKKIDYDLLRKVYEGSTKEDALREWGEPWKRKSENVWIYKFPFMKNKIVLIFKDGVVVKTYGTMW